MKYFFLFLSIFSLTYISNAQVQKSKLIGTVWAENDGNSKYVDNLLNKPISNVMVVLENDFLEKVDTSFTDNEGKYYFEVADGVYGLFIPEYNFEQERSLFGLSACEDFETKEDVDNDNNGIGSWNFSNTLSFKIKYGTEPNGVNKDENHTFDFCFKPDCNEPNTLFNNSFVFNDTICDIDIIKTSCVRMPSKYKPGPDTIFNSNVKDSLLTNISTFAIIGGLFGNYKIKMDFYACVGKGAQIIISTDPNFKQIVYHREDVLDITIQNFLIPGQPYYFLIDGTNGSVCSYDIDIIGNFEPFKLSNLPLEIELDTTNNKRILKVKTVFNYLANIKCVWEITDPNGITTSQASHINDSILLKEPILKGIYKVRCNLYNKCSNPRRIAKEFDILGTTSIDDVEKNNSIIAYPNPTQGQLFIQDISHPYEVSMIDAFWRKANIEKITNNEYSIKNNPPGIYYLVINDENNKIKYSSIIKF